MTKSAAEIYASTVESVIDESGVYPHQAIAVRDDGSMQMMALDVDIHTWSRLFWENVQGPNTAVIFGLDMRTMPDQGTEFADALVFVHWQRDPDKKLADPSCFRTGVINYQNEPRIVRPIDWDNSHWQHWMRSWLQKTRPAFLVRLEKAKS